MIKIKKYHSEYFENCISIFKTNVPHFFDHSEELLFKKYLLEKDILYYVLFNDDNHIVGSGGYGFNNKTNTVDLTWGMVDSNFHKIGFGRRLTEYRIQKIKAKYPKCDILLNTTQHVFKFYEKFGFKITKITNDYYALGLDRYDMINRV